MSTSDTTPPVTAERVRNFRNWKIICVALLLISAAPWVALHMQGRLMLIAAGVVFVACLWVLVGEIPGIRFSEARVSFPARPVPWLPILSLGRRTVLIAGCVEMSVTPQWYGLQLILLESSTGNDLLMFESRDLRIGFTEILKSRRPGLSVYRLEK